MIRPPDARPPAVPPMPPLPLAELLQAGLQGVLSPSKLVRDLLDRMERP